jgi:hypothetical protein
MPAALASRAKSFLKALNPEPLLLHFAASAALDVNVIATVAATKISFFVMFSSWN